MPVIHRDSEFEMKCWHPLSLAHNLGQTSKRVAELWIRMLNVPGLSLPDVAATTICGNDGLALESVDAGWG